MLDERCLLTFCVRRRFEPSYLENVSICGCRECTCLRVKQLRGCCRAVVEGELKAIHDFFIVELVELELDLDF